MKLVIALLGMFTSAVSLAGEVHGCKRGLIRGTGHGSGTSWVEESVDDVHIESNVNNGFTRRPKNQKNKNEIRITLRDSFTGEKVSVKATCLSPECWNQSKTDYKFEFATSRQPNRKFSVIKKHSMYGVFQYAKNKWMFVDCY